MPESSGRPRRIVVGVSGASGAALGLECLLGSPFLGIGPGAFSNEIAAHSTLNLRENTRPHPWPNKQIQRP